VVANVIARMVLIRFAGITPDIGIDVIVMAASALFGIVGARLVSGRVARRVAKADLASALRDQDGLPFGERWTNRVLARLPTGGLIERMALRAIARRRGRAIAVAAQFAGAVAAAVLVASLFTSILDFNDAELESYRWDTATSAADPVFPYSLDDEPAGTEAGIHTWGQIDDWELEVFGVDPATQMFDTAVTAGSWLEPDSGSGTAVRTAVLAQAFAAQEGHAVGDIVTVALAKGSAEYEIVGLHAIRSVAIFVPDQTLAADLDSHGRGDTVWASVGAQIPGADGFATATVSQDDLFAEDAAARDAILAIFGAIGSIVIVIAALGAASTVAMNLYERRAEMATIQATGAERRDVRHLIRAELSSLAAVGWAAGVVAGWLGARAIMGLFGSANAVELGFTMAWVAVPLTAVATIMFVELLTGTAAHRASSRSVAHTLRAAT
jgi:putative ABC transport system permease protein